MLSGSGIYSSFYLTNSPVIYFKRKLYLFLFFYNYKEDFVNQKSSKKLIK